MACSLTYDAVLSRVRVDADSLCVTGVVDTFSRSVTGSWTVADTGQPWTVTGTASDYSVASGAGRQNNVTENSFRTSSLDVSSTNWDYTVSVATDKLAAGSTQIAEAAGRFTDTSNLYAARVTFDTAAGITFDVRKRVAGVQTVLDTVTTSLTHVASTFYSIRVRGVGTSIKAKIWLASQSEPDDWTVEATDGALVTGTQIAHRSVLSAGASNEPVVFLWDNLSTTSAGFAVVDRTTNGVNFTIVRGAAEVGITTGCELERIVDDFEFPIDQEITYRVRSFVEDDSVVTSTTCSITVSLDQVWIKSIGRPFLNQAVYCVSNPTPITRRGRNGVFDVVGRSFPVATTDVRGSREVTVPIVTQTLDQRQNLDLLLASGDPVFFHTPLGHALPTMYAVIEDSVEGRPVRNRDCSNDWRLYELPVIEVAAPGPDVVGSLGTWQTVVNTYLTWADVLLAHPTWADLLELIGEGNEVIVP